MAYLRKNTKVLKNKKQEPIAIITQAVKKIQFTKLIHLKQAKNISKKINEEWLNLRRSYRKKINNKNLTFDLAAEYEAQQQIIFCLMSLLNEKVLDFLEIFL